MPTSPVGTHVAVSSGLIKQGLKEAAETGAEVIQFFVGNPRGWTRPADPSVADGSFRAIHEAGGVAAYVHAPHLINLGSPSEVTVERSADTLRYVISRAAALGVAGVVVHAGSSVDAALRHPALERMRGVLLPILDDLPAGVELLIEPTAGGGGALAFDVARIVDYLVVLDDARLRLCLDTCHLHSAGEDLAQPGALTRVVTELDAAIGSGRIGLVHANDSFDASGSHRDRHETLGAGTIGWPAFAELFAVPSLAGTPILVETPTHEQDVRALKRLREAAALPPPPKGLRDAAPTLPPPPNGLREAAPVLPPKGLRGPAAGAPAQPAQLSPNVASAPVLPGAEATSGRS